LLEALAVEVEAVLVGESVLGADAQLLAGLGVAVVPEVVDAGVVDEYLAGLAGLKKRVHAALPGVARDRWEEFANREGLFSLVVKRVAEGDGVWDQARFTGLGVAFGWLAWLVAEVGGG